MYRVLIRQAWDGEETLVNTDIGDKPRLLACQVTKAVGSFDTLTMTLDPTNPAFGQLRPLQTFVRVVRVQPTRVIFEGRITTLQPSLATGGVIQVQAGAEGLAAFLHDSVQPWAEFHNTTPKNFLQALITNHNSQVEPYKQMKLGIVTVTNSTDNVYRFTDDTKDTYDTITDKLISRMGGELQVRHETDGLYLDYMPAIGKEADQVVRLRSNLLSLSSKLDPTDVITVLKPLGATQQREVAEGESEAAQTSNPRLTIESVNGGSPFMVDKTLAAEFGTQGGVETWDDVKEPANLLRKGQEWFESQRAALETVQLSAVDLSLIGRSVDEFICGNWYRIVCDVMHFDKTLRYVGMMIDIIAPLSSTITAGELTLSVETYTLQLIDQAEHAKLTADYYKSIIDGYGSQISTITKEIAELKNSSSGGEISYYEGNIIDVSEFQGSINWGQVVGAGLALAVIRVQSGSAHEDLTYKANIPAAISAGANYGVYAYFAALNASDAEVEATDFYNRAVAVIGSSRAPRLWMIDVEANSVTSGTLKAAVTAYLNKLNSLGVPDSKIVIYVSNALYGAIDTSRTQIWIPSYGINDGTVANSTKPLHPYDLWQYTSKGVIAGITANTVDMSTEPSDRFKTAFLRK